MSKRNIVLLAFLVGSLFGSLATRYYDAEGQRRVARTISRISASAQNSAEHSLKKERVVSKNSSAEHYVAEVCIVWCFDDRFSSLLNEFTKSRGYKRFDVINVAGGAKDILSDGGYIVDQIKKSCLLHHTKEIILMVHTECGAYGGSKDQTFYVDELYLIKQVATELLKDIRESLKIRIVFAQLDGLYEVN